MSNDGKQTTYVAVGMVTVGFVLMFVAWNGAASLDRIQGQLPYLLSGTAPGLGLVLTGLTLAVVQEIRRTGARVVAHLGTVSTNEGPALAPAVVPDEGAVLATASTFHDRDCHVVAGRSDLTPMGSTDAASRGLRPCRICEPTAAATA